jgi:hypothetical protein
MEQESFIFNKTFRLDLGSTHHSRNGCQGSFHQKVRQLVHEADHFPVSAAEVRNVLSYTFTLPICLHNMHGDNFTFSRPVTLLILSRV